MALKDLLKTKSDNRNLISGFNDPMANQISWDQTKKRSGSAFKTHYAVVEDSSILRFKRAFALKFLPWFVILLSVVLIYVFNDFRTDLSLYTFYDSEQYLKLGVVIFIFLMGVITLWYSSRHIVFDRRIGFYHKGWTKLGDSIPKEGKHCTHLDKIYAIQIISEIVRSKNSRYRSYELNLVLNDGKRINVIDHANQKSIRKDAALLSKFLKIPIWDVSI